MSFPTVRGAASNFGGPGIFSVLATACGLHIADLVIPADASHDASDSAAAHDASDGAAAHDASDSAAAHDASDAEADSQSSCDLRACHADTQCCDTSPRCSAGGECIAQCTALGLDCTISPFPCCFGLFCDTTCRSCNKAGEGCNVDSTCCNSMCGPNKICL